MPRRGSNIYRRKDGRWEGRIRKEEDESGARRYIYVYGKSCGEVKEKMEQIRKSRRAASPGIQTDITVAEVMEAWLKERKPFWKQTTCAVYSQAVEKHIIPRLGHIRADRVNEEVMERFLSDIRQDSEGRTLSDRYLRNICAVIIRAMKYVKKKYHCEMEIPENAATPARAGQLMLPGERDMGALEKYLLARAGDDTCLGILTAFYTGIRIGEVCALTWGDIDLREEVIYIRRNLQRVKTDGGQENGTEILFQTPKTGASLRMIPIPPVLLPLLRQYKKEDTAYVISGRKRRWVEPRTLQYRFAKILEECGIESFNFHMLRHAFATRCIDRGFDVKSLSEILGHSNVQITLNLYVHSSMQRKKQLMEKFDMCLYQNGSTAI